MFGGDSGVDFKANRKARSHVHNLTFHSTLDSGQSHNQLLLTMTVPSFETIFAVPMTCQSCIDDIEGSLQQLSGTSATDARHSASDSVQVSTRSRPTSRNS